LPHRTRSDSEIDQKIMSSNSDQVPAGGNAVRDALTASFSRAYFIDALSIERQFAVDSCRPFTLCLLDIDQLRSVNDEYGQQTGDAVLAGIAESIRSTLDLPQWQNLRCLQARFDGDAFTLLLPGCQLRRGEQFAHVLRRRIADAKYAGALNMTVSIAVAAYQAGESIDELLARVERTMHLAKQFGNDVVETAPTPELKQRTASVTRLPVAWHGPRLSD
jgi:diguanylate cyclase (GGDEF)-like protein